LQLLIGPAHDALHIDADSPNGYEWWYFDAMSEDGRYALVAIFFLGAPMSPYYNRVADGRDPLPRDWCGVFFSVHEKKEGRWLERAWNYNLYPVGEFVSTNPKAHIGESSMRGQSEADGWAWDLIVNERGLWRGRSQAFLRFQMRGDDRTSDMAHDAPNTEGHTWVCTAPVCDVFGELQLTRGAPIAFTGTGYHDHNFGRLPWDDVAAWYWGRARYPAAQGGKTLVFYQTFFRDGSDEPILLEVGADGAITRVARDMAVRLEAPVRAVYGLRHSPACRWNGGSMIFEDRHGVFSEGPFYRRLPARVETEDGVAGGIGEVFEPARLRGPIASRAMWTRMRRL